MQEICDHQLPLASHPFILDIIPGIRVRLHSNARLQRHITFGIAVAAMHGLWNLLVVAQAYNEVWFDIWDDQSGLGGSGNIINN